MGISPERADRDARLGLWRVGGRMIGLIVGVGVAWILRVLIDPGADSFPPVAAGGGVVAMVVVTFALRRVAERRSR